MNKKLPRDWEGFKKAVMKLNEAELKKAIKNETSESYKIRLFQRYNKLRGQRELDEVLTKGGGNETTNRRRNSTR